MLTKRLGSPVAFSIEQSRIQPWEASRVWGHICLMLVAAKSILGIQTRRGILELQMSRWPCNG